MFSIMSKRFPLHLQIFAALILSLVFGFFFSTNYLLNENRLVKLKHEINNDTLINELSTLKDKRFSSLPGFENALKKTITTAEFKEYGNSIIKNAYYNPFLKWIDWIGIIFLRALKMLVIPLIITSIVSGIVNIGTGKNLGRLGLKTISYYIFTSIAAILTGLLFVDVFKPGEGVNISGIESMSETGFQHKTLKEILIEIVPDNIFKSLQNNDLLSIIFISVLAGIFITRLNKRSSESLTNMFNSLFELVMQITMFVIKLAPIGVFALVAKVVADQADIAGLIKNLGNFVFCVMSALMVHALITLPVIMRFIGKLNPFKHFKNMISAILTAFSTASSAAALPLTMKNVQENSGVSQKIANFTLPIGATVNMDGTAIYITAVVMFIAQSKGLVMGPKEQTIILLTALLTSIGTAAIPMASLVIITIILDIFGLPFELIALILPVDRILDMFRTSVNVWSDSCGAAIIAKSEGEILNI